MDSFMQGIESLSDVERLKFLKNIRIGMSSDSDFDEYIKKYAGSMGFDECKRRLNGYFLEDEFALMCFLMRSCSSLSPLGQSGVNNVNTKVPDYLASFHLPKGKEFKCFIEVKTANGMETNKISNNFHNKYKEFCYKFKLPLFFASRIQQGNLLFWIIQSESEFVNSGRKAKVDNLSDSSNSILLNDCFITVTSPLVISLSFSKEKIDSSIYFENRGYIKGMTISQLDKTGAQSVVIQLNANEYFLNILLGEFQCEMSYNEENMIETRVIPFLSSDLISSLLLKMNKKIVDPDSPDDRLNASRLLAKIEQGYSSYIDVNRLFLTVKTINEKFTEAGGERVFMTMLLGSDKDRKMKLNYLLKQC